ncbi:MAG: thiamine-phosphate kinase [Gammaproteobacteria bacterium]|nr:thiamine-phosphate kinase [Gammaproteobacteria bacterium]MDH3857668.1 thiamine-phosphate kinase [Gammaproteobacteria bacterium]
MAHDEFAIIEEYFTGIGDSADDVLLAVGDDAAVVEVAPEHQLVVSMDTLVGGVHFPIDTNPADIAYKSLAVNLSDLAAMAASPAWFLLSLTLPRNDPQWLREFAGGLRQTADDFKLPLIGGDTCRGELSITVQIAGVVPTGQYVTRQHAKPGDLILVSGELGNAGLGLAFKQGLVDLPQDLQTRCLKALDRPQPRLELIPFLREFASAAIDISDGLQGDLAHVLKASQCGARISRDSIPVNPWIAQQQAYQYALGAGDDYEICCCLPARYQREIENWNLEHPACRLTVIGEIIESGIFLREGESLIELGDAQGYQHFG